MSWFGGGARRRLVLPSVSAAGFCESGRATTACYRTSSRGSDIERKQEVKNARGGDDEEKDDTNEDQVNLCIALVYATRGVL